MNNKANAKIIFLLLMIDPSVSFKDSCCSFLQVTLTGSAKEHQASRNGIYELQSSDRYQQIGGKNFLYRFERKKWFFGVDTHTSGIRSTETLFCPENVEKWKFWMRDENWMDASTYQINVVCRKDSEEYIAMIKGLNRDGENSNILYTAEDGPNVDCSKLQETHPDAVYPPHPRVALLGKTGVGKSTLGNQLLGCYRRDKTCRVFGMGHGRKSHTNKTFWAVGNYLGKGGCITLIDTPGASDSEGRDYEHVLQMVHYMKNELKSLDVFLLMFQGTQTRISMELTQLLKLYESIFTKEFWKHAITEISFWKWDERSVEERLEDQGMDSVKKHNDWQLHYKEKFNIKEEIPTLFIDPVFPIFSKTEKKQKRVKRQPEAVQKFAFYTNMFWDLAQGMHPFDCKERCSAPANYYSGAPWVKPSLSRGRENTPVSVICQVWKFGSFAADHVVWKFNDAIIYEKNSTDILTRPDWVDKIKVTLVEYDRFLELHFTILNLNLETQGIYTCENEKDSPDNKVDVRIIKDGSWAEWETWGSCSKTCMHEGSDLGIKIRRRNCTLPEYGGTPCPDNAAEERTSCKTPLCPIDHVIGEWSGWSDCSMPCGIGTSTRQRKCTEGLHGGTPCPVLEEKQTCNKKPCRECKVYEWSVWSSCSISCLDTSKHSSLGTKTRSRPFEELDPDNPVCHVDSMKEIDQCAGDGHGKNILCPVDAQWSSWSEWTLCSATCGGGSQQRQRTCKQQRFGGNTCNQLSGKREEVQSCRIKPCPIDCEVSQWSTWSQCNQKCGKGVKKSVRSIVQAAQFGGRKCGIYLLERFKECSLKRCRCDSYMKQWTPWTTCTYNRRTRRRTKSIDLAKQKSEFTGMDCSNTADIAQEEPCPGKCPDDWKEFKGYCYKLSESPKNFDEAVRLCNIEQASLASVKNKEINDFIFKELGADSHIGHSNRRGIFIGASDKRREGNWKWTDGSRWGYENWYGKRQGGDEPNDKYLDHDEDCVEIVLNVDNRHLKKEYWNDISCSLTNLFVCSKPIQ